MALTLSVLPGTFSVHRLAPGSPLPPWIDRTRFWSVTETRDELSIVCADTPATVGENAADEAVGSANSERDWRILAVQGPLDFGLTGILASIANPLAAEKISIFAISTFDTDYVLVKDARLADARAALAGAGFRFSEI